MQNVSQEQTKQSNKLVHATKSMGQMLKTVTTFFHFLINALYIMYVLIYQEIFELTITYILYLNVHWKSVQNRSLLNFKISNLYTIYLLKTFPYIVQNLIYDHLYLSLFNIFNEIKYFYISQWPFHLNKLIMITNWNLSIYIHSDIHNHKLFCHNFISILSFLKSNFSYYDHFQSLILFCINI